MPQSTVSCRSDSILEANSSCCHRSDISNASARVAPDLLKALAILPDTTVRKSAVVNWEDPKPYWKSERIWRKIYFAVTHLKKIWVGVLKF